VQASKNGTYWALNFWVRDGRLFLKKVAHRYPQARGNGRQVNPFGKGHLFVANVLGSVGQAHRLM
jgi:hypothetical protein